MSDLIDGFAQLIADNDLGVWNESGTYTASQTGIFRMFVAPSPDRILAISSVPMTANVALPMGSALVQIRGRGNANNPDDVNELLDPILQLVTGLTNQTMGSTHIVQVQFQSSAPLGMDQNFRWERADQYLVDIDTPPTSNRPHGGR